MTMRIYTFYRRGDGTIAARDCATRAPRARWGCCARSRCRTCAARCADTFVDAIATHVVGAVRPRRARDVRDAETVGADDAGAKFKEKVRRDVGARHGRVDGDRTIARGGAVGSRAERRDRGAGRRGAGGDDEGAAGATRGEARGAGDTR